MNQCISKMLYSAWPTLSQLQVDSMGTVVESPGATFGPRRQHSWEFLWVKEGVLEAKINRKTIRGGEGLVLLVPPGVVDRYDFGGRRRSVHAYIHFDFKKTRPPWPPESHWPLRQVLPGNHPFFDAFRTALSLDDLSQRRHLALLAPCLELMVRLFVLGAPRPSPPQDPGLHPAVERVLGWIIRTLEHSPTSRPTLPDLARQGALSSQHLLRLFRKQLGASPMRCISLLRVRNAGSLLERTTLTLKEIADRSGYENPFHFSRAFKRLYGVPPSLYRTQFHQGRAYRPELPLFQTYPLRKHMIHPAVALPESLQRFKQHPLSERHGKRACEDRLPI
jgi:AraC family transcriptional regulator